MGGIKDLVPERKVRLSFTRKDYLHEVDVEEFREYFNKNLGKTIFEFDGNYYDIRTLNNRICLSMCLQCHKFMTDYCCGGQPYSIEEDREEYIKSILPSIIDSYPIYQKESLVESINDYGGFITSGGSFITNSEEDCIFSYTNEDGSKCCGLHKYALNNNIDVYSIKPIACSLFPLDILDLSDGSKFIFCCDDDIMFDRWEDTYYNHTNICTTPKVLSFIKEGKVGDSINKDFVYDEDAMRLFLNASYKPAYIEQKDILVKLFGEQCIKFISDKSEELFGKISE